jgi:hypothetical protein
MACSPGNYPRLSNSGSTEQKICSWDVCAGPVTAAARGIEVTCRGINLWSWTTSLIRETVVGHVV